MNRDNPRKSKMGRPPVPKKLKRSVQISISLTESEYQQLQDIAGRDGLSVSELLMRPWRQEKKA